MSEIFSSTSMEQNIINSTECQQQGSVPSTVLNSQHQFVKCQDDNSTEQVKPSNMASLGTENRDVICIEDEIEETASNKTEDKTVLEKISCMIQSGIEQDDPQSQTLGSQSLSSVLQESGVNTGKPNENQPSEIESCKVCRTSDGEKNLGGLACYSCSMFFKQCVEDGMKLTRHTEGAKVCHCQLCRLLRCYFVGMEPKDSSFVVCSICGKAFLSLYFLKQHLGKCKKSTFSYNCANCEQEFVTECQYRLHKKSVFFCKKRDAESSLKYNCDVCWKSFSSLGVLIMHRYTHINFDREMLEMENSLEMHDFQNDSENPVVIDDSKTSEDRVNKQGDACHGKKVNTKQITLLSQLDCSIIDFEQDEYMCLQGQNQKNCDEIENSKEILSLQPGDILSESRNKMQIALSTEKGSGKDDMYGEIITSGEGESRQDSVSRKHVFSEERHTEPLDLLNGNTKLGENLPTGKNDVTLQVKDKSVPGKSLTGTELPGKAPSEIVEDKLLDDEDEDEDYIIIDFDSSDEEDKHVNVDQKNDLSENLETLQELYAFSVKNETMCNSVTETTSNTEQDISSPVSKEKEFPNPTSNYSSGVDDQPNEALPDNKDLVKEENIKEQSNGEMEKKNLSESEVHVPVNIKQESAELNEFPVLEGQNEKKSASSFHNVDDTSEASTSQSSGIFELISAILPSSTAENSLTGNQSHIQSLINQLGLKSKVKVTSSDDGTKKVELHFIVNDKMDLDLQLTQTNDELISSSSNDASNDEVSSTVPDDQCLVSNGHSSSDQSLLSQVNQTPRREFQVKEEAPSSEVSSTDETVTVPAKNLDDKVSASVDGMDTKPPLHEIDGSKKHEESNEEEVADQDIICLSSDEEELPVVSTKAACPTSESLQGHLKLQPQKQGVIIVDNCSGEKETEHSVVTSKEMLLESEKCIEESKSADKFSLLRKYLNTLPLQITEQPSAFSNRNPSDREKRSILGPATSLGYFSGQKLSCTVRSRQENNSKLVMERFKCYLCNNIYFDLQELKLHLNQTHSYYQYNENDLNNFHCCHCADEFDSTAKVSIHEHSVHGVRFSCPFCGVFQRSHKQFLQHFICHFSLIVYYCNLCNREFSKYVGHGCPTPLSRAMKCFLCDRTFFDKERYCNHNILQHSELFKYTCKACLQKFATPLALKVHRSSLNNTLDGVQVNIADTLTLNAKSMEVTVLKETPLTAMHRPYISTPLTSSKEMTNLKAGDTVRSYGNPASLDLPQVEKTLGSSGKKGELANNIGQKGELASTSTSGNVDGLCLPKIMHPKKSKPYKPRSVTLLSDSQSLVKKTTISRIPNMPLIMKNVYTGEVEMVDKRDGDVNKQTQSKSDGEISQQSSPIFNGQKVTIPEFKQKGRENAFIPIANLPNLQSNRISEKDCHTSFKRKSEDSGSSTSAIPNKQARQGSMLQGDGVSALETDGPQKSISSHGRGSSGTPYIIDTISFARCLDSEIRKTYHDSNKNLTPEVIVLDGDESDCSLPSSPEATSTSRATSTPGAKPSNSGVFSSTAGTTSSTGATSTPGDIPSNSGATSSTTVTASAVGATSTLGTATKSPGEFRGDSWETPSNRDPSKEEKTEERLLSQNQPKRVPERKRRVCENLSEEVEGVISNLLQFWKKSETVTKPVSTDTSGSLTKKPTLLPTTASLSPGDRALSDEVKGVSNHQSNCKMSNTDGKEMKRKSFSIQKDDIKKKRISEKEENVSDNNEEKSCHDSILSGVDPEPTYGMESNTSPSSIPKEAQNMFITKSVLSVIESNPTLLKDALKETQENLRKKSMLPMHPYLIEFTKITELKNSPVALANANALLHRRVPANSLSKPPFINQDEGNISYQKQKIFSDITAALEKIESVKYMVSKQPLQKLKGEISKWTYQSEEKTSGNSVKSMASRETMQKLRAELSKRTPVSGEQPSVSKPPVRINAKDSEVQGRPSVYTPVTVTQTPEHQNERANSLVEKQVSIDEPVSEAPIYQNESNDLIDEKATVKKPVSKPTIHHTKSDLEYAVKQLSSVVKSIAKGKIE